MAFGIIRVKNLHQGDLKSTEKHNARLYEAGHLPANITGTEFTHTQTGKTLDEAVQARFEEAKVKARTDSVVAIEYVVSISQTTWSKLSERHDIEPAEMLEEFYQFVDKKHGKQNVISTSIHLDESNPHMHIIVTPIIEKEVKWKNNKGEGVRKENRLCARDFTGDKEKLRQLQTDYFQYIESNFGGILKSAGDELKRGVDARDRVARKQYYSRMTNHVVGQFRKELYDMYEAFEEKRITAEKLLQKENALRTKIEAISGNIEKKAGKDIETFKKSEKWANTSRDLSL